MLKKAWCHVRALPTECFEATLRGIQKDYKQGLKHESASCDRVKNLLKIQFNLRVKVAKLCRDFDLGNISLETLTISTIPRELRDTETQLQLFGVQ